MTGFEFLFYVLWNILWPPKGIIYMEEQAIQWIVAFSHAWIKNYGAAILMVITIYLAIMMVVFARMPRMRPCGGTFARIFHFIWSILSVVLLAWFFLIYGALRGELNGNRGERTATAEHQYNNRVGRHFGATYRVTRLSLHFRLGRGLFRLFYRLIDFVPVIARNERVHEIVARVLAMVVILWGVWNIPYDIMH